MSGLLISHALTARARGDANAEVFVRAEPLFISIRRARAPLASAHSRTVKAEAIDTDNTTQAQTANPFRRVITIEDESDDGLLVDLDSLLDSPLARRTSRNRLCSKGCEERTEKDGW